MRSKWVRVSGERRVRVDHGGTVRGHANSPQMGCALPGPAKQLARRRRVGSARRSCSSSAYTVLYVGVLLRRPWNRGARAISRPACLFSVAHHPASGCADGLVCVVQDVLGADETEFDRDAEPFARLDQVFASAGMAGAGLPGVRRGPGRDQFLLRPGERGDLADAGQLAGRQAAHDGDGAPLDEAAGLGAVLLGGQGVQVGQRMGDHDGAHPLGPVQPASGCRRTRPGPARRAVPATARPSPPGRSGAGRAAARPGPRRRRPSRTRAPRCTASRR